MEIILQIIILALGFALLIKGADLFVDGTASIAARFGIPQLIIGLTVVAMGTSAPEAAVSISAAFDGNADITIGNILGSNILNILIILGISAVITSIAVSKATVRIDIPIMLASSVLLLLLGLDGQISRLDAVLIFACFIGFMVYMVFSAIKGNDSGDNIKVMSVPASLLFAVGGLLIIIVGSKLTVHGATAIAKYAGLSERFIGLTVAAFGTSLPELFTSVTGAKKGNTDMAIGNIVGSNIFNILFVVGLSGLAIPVPFDKSFMFDAYITIASGVLLLLACLKGRRLSRPAGIIFLVGYCIYFACII